MLPSLSMAIPFGLEPVVPRIVDVPSGVILETFFESALAVYMLPALSIVTPFGSVPVVPRIVDVPSGVILETEFAKRLAV